LRQWRGDAARAQNAEQRHDHVHGVRQLQTNNGANRQPALNQGLRHR